MEKDLRTKCKRPNNHNKPLENGKKLYVVANGRLRSRDADGRINYKNSLDFDRLISEIDATSKGSDRLFLHCCLFNARSLNNKLTELSYLLDVESPSIAFITETWFNANTSDNCISAGKSTYNILRFDRPSAGGGVCIIVDESHCHISSSTAISNFNYSIIQAYIIAAHHLINVKCCYLLTASGRLNYDVARVTFFVGDIHKLLDAALPNYLVGYFNLKNVDWSSPCTPRMYLLALLIENGLSQLVNEYTREQTFLDLMFTDCNGSYVNVMVCEPFSTSDYSMIWFHLILPGRLNPVHVIESEAQFNYTRADWDAVNLALSTVKGHALVNDDVLIETAWRSFCKCINDVISITILKKSQRRRESKYIRYPKSLA